MKKKLILIGKIILVILALPFILMMLSEYTGIGKKEDGFRAYKACSPFKEGEHLIEKYKIKCVAKGVETLAFIEVDRGETFFAYNVDHSNYFVYEKIKYNKIPGSVVKKYKFYARFTWLQKNGKYFAYTLFGACLLGFAFMWWKGKI